MVPVMLALNVVLERSANVISHENVKYRIIMRRSKRVEV